MDNRTYRSKSGFLTTILLFSLAFIALTTVSTVSASSTVIYVNGSHGNDANNGLSWATAKLTIKNATGTVTNGGTINIANGQYKGTSNTNITIKKNINIQGQSSSGTIINGTNKTRIFNILNGFNVNIQNLTLTGGYAHGNGDAIYNKGNLTLTSVIFTKNYGCAIYNNGTLTVDNCNLKYNNNAIYSIHGTITIKKSIFNYNAENAVYCTDGTLTVLNSTFNHNSAGANGGAIQMYVDSTLTVDNCTFKYNTAGSGGAIYNNDGIGYILNSVFINNTAEDGGAIYQAGNFGYYGEGILTVENCTFLNNTAEGYNFDNSPDYYGGAISCNSGTTIIKKCSFTHNIAKGDGGAIYLLGDALTVENCTFNYNSATGEVSPPSNIYYITDGGGAICAKSNLNVNNCIFKCNRANNSYGGAILNTATLNTNNCTFINNIATKGGAIYNFFGDVTMRFSKSIGNSPQPIYNYIDSSGSGPVDADLTQPTARANYKTGIYNTAKVITLTISGSGKIYYTKNGTTPTNKSIEYTGPITINKTTTLKFIAVDKAGNISPVYTEKYTIDRTTPKVTSTYPKRYATGVSRTRTIYLKFSEKIKASSYWSKIVVKNRYGHAVSISKSISGNVLYIKTKYKRSSYSYYTVYIPRAAVKDYASNKLTKGYIFKFKTGKY